MPGKIAVIDDDAPFIRFAERALAALNYDCCPITTFDADEIVRVLIETRCDAALVDVFMYSRPSGFTSVESVRSHPATEGLPLLVVSGAHDRLAKAAQFLAAHRCHVLPKPFGLDALERELAAMLEPVVTLPQTDLPPVPALAPSAHAMATA